MIRGFFEKLSCRALAFFLAAVISTPAFSQEQESGQGPKPRTLPVQDIFDTRELQVETVADSLEYLKNENKVIAKGNVVISHGSEKITADYAEVETDTKKAYAKGHVIIFKGDAAVAKGEEIHYDFNQHSGTFPQGSLVSPPWHCKGRDLRKVDEDTFAAEDAVFTTCKGDKPP